MMKWFIFLLLVTTIILGMQGYLDPIVTILSSEKFTFRVGQIKFTLFVVLKSIIVVILLLWIASIISSLLQYRLRQTKGLSAANRTIILQLFSAFVYVAIFLLAFDFLGIDLTTFAIFGGAIGIGLGFALQKITSNFVSGIILLFEKSVKEGDLIELVDGTTGFVRHNGARYTLIETLDSKEVMVPNEDFITNRVVNLTFTNPNGRIEIAVGVAYGSDLEKVRSILLAAAKSHPSCSRSPEPACFLREFGDSSINFLLYFWIDDVTKGRYKPQSEVMFSVWHAFEKNGIQIPFPQRDLHIKNTMIKNDMA